MDKTFSDLIDLLHKRFDKNMHRHEKVQWKDVVNKLKNNEIVLKALLFMEQTGGEPDLVDEKCSSGKYWYVDCSKETPEGRRSLCYDKKGG